ncbi:hypothetical protein [Clostridium sp. JN-9]|uniref:hypothetical protein n=1 Tax=Clostridium sp. JN-9 TaxID=2507159 RepID=UPI000FFE25F5|nr:hypothetical protein [Clostridium sp. JN-9]QAT39535.1 hypothetical protein EQM05_04310 [Clostridium sp. JN-9]
MTKIKFTYADFKIAPYTGNVKTDINNATKIGLLAGGIKLEGDIKTKDVKPYGFTAKVFEKNELETAKASTDLIEINAANIAKTGLFSEETETSQQDLSADVTKQAGLPISLLLTGTDQTNFIFKINNVKQTYVLDTDYSIITQPDGSKSLNLLTLQDGQTVNITYTAAVTIDTGKYALQNPNTQYLLVVEEKEVNTNGERLRWIFYPCVLSGKFIFDYNDKEMHMPLEYTVYADENDPEGRLGLRYEKIV